MPKSLIKNLLVLVLFFTQVMFSEAYAIEDPARTPYSGDDTHVLEKDMRASNPDCAAAALISAVSFGAIGAGVPSIFAGVKLNRYASTVSFPLVAKVLKGISITMVLGGTAATIGGIIGAPEWGACAFAYVKHPVLRYGTDDPSGHKAGAYRECLDPEPSFPRACRKVFQKEDDYFICIDDNISNSALRGVSFSNGTTRPDKIERGKRKEPRCKSGKFKEVSDYVWPQNRAASSEYVEVCYRNPMGAWYVYATMGVAILFNSFLVDLELREKDYGSTDLHNLKYLFNGEIKCSTLSIGQSEIMHGIKYSAVDGEGGEICAKAVGMGELPWVITPIVGCHRKPFGPPVPMCASSVPTVSSTGHVISYNNKSCYSCYIADSCTGHAGGHTFALFPVSSVIIECLRESLNNMLTSDCVNSQSGQAEKGFLVVAQQRLKNAVNAVLVLACMLLATKAVAGALQQPKAELVIFVLKLSLVLYLTNGSAISHYYDQLVKFSIGLSDMVLASGGNETICDYKTEDYRKAFPGHDYSYLAPWDRLDCRVAFYFGSQLNGNSAAAVFALLLPLAWLALALLVTNAYILVSIMALFAVIMIIIVVSWMLYLFILSMIALSILILLSPLFLPMMLFQSTKGFYDSWIKEVMTYTLYPVMLFAFLALIFSVFDNVYFGTLKFERYETTILGTSSKRIGFKLITKDPSNPSKELDQCGGDVGQGTLACLLHTYQVKPRVLFWGKTFDELIYAKSSKGAVALWTRVGMMGLLAFLFYHFLTILGGMAAELAGNPRGDLSRGVKSPARVLQGVMGGLNSVRNKIQSGAKSALKSGRDKGAKSGQESGDGKISSGKEERSKGGGGES